MKIRFNTSTEDIVAFNRFHCENSPMWRRQRIIRASLVPVILAFFSLYIYTIKSRDMDHDPDAQLSLGIALVGINLAVSVPLYFFLSWRILSSVTSGVRKLLAEGSNRALLGWREMELANGRLFVKTELLEISMDMRAIEKIVANEQYTFVYYSSITAYLIPMNLFPEDEYREFVAELREAWHNRDAFAPVE